MQAARQGGRANQRFRTRTALVVTAAALVRAGGQPSVAEVAEAARVSRRTAYRYFPTQEQLLTEAALEALRPRIEASFAGADEADPQRRLAAAVRALQEESIRNESLLRTMIRLTIERKPADPDDALPRRGVRRVEWLEAALGTAGEALPRPAFERLVSALALCVGAEALIVLRDVRALAPEATVEVCVWAAQALLRSALAETAPSGG